MSYESDLLKNVKRVCFFESVSLSRVCGIPYMQNGELAQMLTDVKKRI